MKTSWTCTEPEVSALARQINIRLQQFGRPFVMLLNGQMGAGKTALTREILYDIGLNRKVPVQSPTFTYLNEYHIEGQLFGHIDLYRLEDATDLSDFFGVEFDRFAGVFIEWPNSSLNLTGIAPTHKMTIDLDDDMSRRHYVFEQL